MIAVLGQPRTVEIEASAEFGVCPIQHFCHFFRSIHETNFDGVVRSGIYHVAFY